MDKVFYINQDEQVRHWSNFARCNVIIRGQLWKTTEHFFQAAKFFNTEPEWAEEIRNADRPSQTFNMGRDRSHSIDPNWEKGLKL